MKENDRASQVNRNRLAVDSGRLEFSPIERGLHGYHQRFLIARDRPCCRDLAIFGNVAVKLHGSFQAGYLRIFRKMDVTGERVRSRTNDRGESGSVIGWVCDELGAGVGAFSTAAFRLQAETENPSERAKKKTTKGRDAEKLSIVRLPR